MIKVNIEQVREALEGATGGKWWFDDMCYLWSGQQMVCQIRGWGHLTSTKKLSEEDAIKVQDNNAKLIANMCSQDGWGKQMADEIERLRSEVAELKRKLSQAQEVALIDNDEVDAMVSATGGNDEE